MARFSYSRWDGTQVGFDYGADNAFRELTDELLYHGELNHALQRLLQRGFRDRNGAQVAGLRELLEQVRRRRQELLDSHDVSSPLEDIARRLEEVLRQERGALDDAYRQARGVGGEPDRADAAAEAGLRLDLLPPDLAGRLRELQSYEWSDP
jgi:uncharacterized protein with von Willebrand factor type A (vWA) domain